MRSPKKGPRKCFKTLTSRLTTKYVCPSKGQGGVAALSTMSVRPERAEELERQGEVRKPPKQQREESADPISQLEAREKNRQSRYLQRLENHPDSIHAGEPQEATYKKPDTIHHEEDEEAVEKSFNLAIDIIEHAITERRSPFSSVSQSLLKAQVAPFLAKYGFKPNETLRQYFKRVGIDVAKYSGQEKIKNNPYAKRILDSKVHEIYGASPQGDSLIESTFSEFQRAAGKAPYTRRSSVRAPDFKLPPSGRSQPSIGPDRRSRAAIIRQKVGKKLPGSKIREVVETPTGYKDVRSAETGKIHPVTGVTTAAKLFGQFLGVTRPSGKQYDPEDFYSGKAVGIKDIEADPLGIALFLVGGALTRGASASGGAVKPIKAGSAKAKTVQQLMRTLPSGTRKKALGFVEKHYGAESAKIVTPKTPPPSQVDLNAIANVSLVGLRLPPKLARTLNRRLGPKTATEAAEQTTWAGTKRQPPIPKGTQEKLQFKNESPSHYVQLEYKPSKKRPTESLSGGREHRGKTDFSWLREEVGAPKTAKKAPSKATRGPKKRVGPQPKLKRPSPSRSPKKSPQRQEGGSLKELRLRMKERRGSGDRSQSQSKVEQKVSAELGQLLRQEGGKRVSAIVRPSEKREEKTGKETLTLVEPRLILKEAISSKTKPEAKPKTEAEVKLKTKTKTVTKEDSDPQPKDDAPSERVTSAKRDASGQPKEDSKKDPTLRREEGDAEDDSSAPEYKPKSEEIRAKLPDVSTKKTSHPKGEGRREPPSRRPEVKAKLSDPHYQNIGGKQKFHQVVRKGLGQFEEAIGIIESELSKSKSYVAPIGRQVLHNKISLKEALDKVPWWMQSELLDYVRRKG